MSNDVAEYVSKAGKVVKVYKVSSHEVSMSIDSELMAARGKVVAYGNVVGMILDGEPVVLKRVSI